MPKNLGLYNDNLSVPRKQDIDAVASALQSKQDNIVGGASTITDDNLTANRALVSDGNGKVAVSNVTSTELGYLDGVTSNVQTQLNKKLESAPVTSVNAKTGAVVLSASDVGALPTSGGTLTGNLTVGSAKIQTNGYVVGTWLQGTATNHLTNAATKIAVQDDSGWVYHRTAEEIKSDIGLSNVDNVKQYSASNPPPYPVASVNGKTGRVNLVASDVGAVSAANVTQTLGSSTTKVPSEKAVADALSGAGAGDMLKATYDPTGSVETAGGIPDYVAGQLPTVNDATLTIQKNGTAVGTFTANASANKSINITMAKGDVGLSNVDNVKQYSADNPPPYPVTSVNGQTGDVEIQSGSEAASYTATLTTSGWAQSGSRYSQTVNVTGVTASTPVVLVDVALSGTDIDADAAILEAWGIVSANNVAQGNGTMTFYALSVPSINIPVNVGVC